MKNFLEKVSKWRLEIIFSVCFIVCLCLIALPFASLNWVVDDETTNFIGDISFINALVGGNVEIEGTNYALKNTSVLLIFGLVAFILSEVLVIGNAFIKNKRTKTILHSTALVFVLFTIFAFMLGGFCLVSLDLSSFAGGGYLESTTLMPFGATFSVFSLLMALILFSYIFNAKKYSVQEIAETAIMVALAVVLDQFCKIPIQANGGSISFSALPLFIIAIRYGAFKGFIASGFIFGFITCLMDGYGFQTFPFDYLIALGGYGLVGTFYNFAKRFYSNIEDSSKYRKMQFIYSAIAVVLAGIPVMIIRYAGHMIDGAILYGLAEDPLANFIYQSTYVPGAVWISIAATVILLEPIILINRIFPVKKVNNIIENEEETVKLENN